MSIQEQTLVEAYAQAMDKLGKDPLPVILQLSKVDAWQLGIALQLVCRHPKFTGPIRQMVEQLARKALAEIATADTALQILAAMGWQEKYDGAAADLDGLPLPEPEVCDPGLLRLVSFMEELEVHPGAERLRIATLLLCEITQDLGLGLDVLLERIQGTWHTIEEARQSVAEQAAAPTGEAP